MKKIKAEKTKNGVWSDWINPRMTNYHMGCCDCNLYHTLNFKVVRVLKTRTRKGKKIGELVRELSKKEYKVMFKVKRNKKMTKEQRKKNNITIKH